MKHWNPEKQTVEYRYKAEPWRKRRQAYLERVRKGGRRIYKKAS